jgi:hypothetical protein
MFLCILYKTILHMSSEIGVTENIPDYPISCHSTHHNVKITYKLYQQIQQHFSQTSLICDTRFDFRHVLVVT